LYAFPLQVIKPFRDIRHNSDQVTVVGTVVSRRGCILPGARDSTKISTPSKIVIMDEMGDVREIVFWATGFTDTKNPHDQRVLCDCFVNNFRTWETYEFKNLKVQGTEAK
jgi:hypothetical protein